MSQLALIEVEPAPEPESFERYTPTKLFRELTAGVTLELDTCATAESTKCPRYYSLKERGEDALQLPWDAPSWNNPRWDLIDPWVAKAHDETITGRCPLLYQLLPVRTDRPWWHEYIEPHRDGRGKNLVTTRFVRDRQRFGKPGDPEGLDASSPNFWVVLLVWRRP
jgi:hypothetical protein